MSTNAYHRLWRQENPDKVRAINRLYKYGITQDEFDSIYARQGGKCAICLVDFDEKERTTRPHVDHCHLTGKVRGLLCLACNSGLGQFGDDLVMLTRALNYLQHA